jgi:hypothetical protein
MFFMTILVWAKKGIGQNDSLCGKMSQTHAGWYLRGLLKSRGLSKKGSGKMSYPNLFVSRIFYPTVLRARFVDRRLRRPAAGNLNGLELR